MRFPRLHPVAAAAAAITSLAGGLAGPAAFAQQAPAQPAPSAPAAAPAGATSRADPERIVITATKRNEAAHRVPINVTAIGEEQLREENITELKSLIQASPAIDAPPNSARFADSVTVRGLNISSVSANNVEWFVRSTLSYYLDDTPLPNIGYRIKDVARVETLLGPQGTLYGGGALGGTIRYITNQPRLGRTEGRISTSFYVTKHGGLSNDTDGVINLPIGQNVALRVSLARLDEAGYTDRFAGTPGYLRRPAPTFRPWTPKPDAGRDVYADDDYQKVNTARVSALWRLTPDLDLTLSHATQSQLAHGTSGAQLLPARGNPGRYLAPPAFDKQTVLSPYPEFADRDFELTSLDVSWKLPFGRLHSSTSAFKDTRKGQADYLATGWFFYGDLGYSRYRVDRDNFGGNTAFITFDNAYKGTVHETRIVSDPGRHFDWLAGLYYARQERALKFDENLPTLPTSGPAGVGYFENQASEYTERALYGELTWKPTPRWRVTAGARLFSYDDEQTTEVVDYAFDLVSGVVRNKEKGSNKAYYKLNAAYQLDPDFLLYATASQGFRRGGANGFRNIGASVVAPSARAYQADSTNNYELGAKGFLLDKQLFLQLSLYRIDWKQPQTYFSQDIEGFPVWGTTNGPDARSQGIELQGRYNIAGGWQASFSSTRTSAKWAGTKRVCLYVVESNDTCRTYAEGGKLGGSPAWKHTLGVRWDGELSGYPVNASLRARYTGKKPSDRGDSPDALVFEYESYTTLNASVGTSFGKFDVSLWVNNLADDRTLVSFQGTSAVGDRAGLRAIYLTPRTVGVNASYRF